MPKDTAQKLKFSSKDFFSKCDQIHSFLRIWSHLLKKSLMENFNFCAVGMNQNNGIWRSRVDKQNKRFRYTTNFYRKFHNVNKMSQLHDSCNI